MAGRNRQEVLDVGRFLVIACSALKRAYRDTIRDGDASVVFVHLHGNRELLNERMNSRPGHFMPASLLDSQLSTLEHLHFDEEGMVVDIQTPVEQIVDQAVDSLLGPGDDARGSNFCSAVHSTPGPDFGIARLP